VRVSFAGLMVWDANVSDGSDRAVAHTLEVEDAGALDADADVGEDGERAVVWPCLGLCRCSWRAFARAFSWVRTKYARFWRAASVHV